MYMNHTVAPFAQMFDGELPFSEALPPSFASLVEPATAEAAVFSRGDPLLSNSVWRCGCCLRADTAGRPIGLTTLAREGTLYRVCTSCFLLCELQAAVTDGHLSLAVEEQVVTELRSLYTFVCGELCASARDGSRESERSGGTGQAPGSSEGRGRGRPSGLGSGSHARSASR